MAKDISPEFEAIMPKIVEPSVPTAVSDREIVRAVAIDMVVITVLLAIAIAGTAFARMKSRDAARARPQAG